MTNRNRGQYLIGIAVLAAALVGCASTPTKDFTLAALQEDIGGTDNLSGCQFFISKDVFIKYKRVIREAKPVDKGLDKGTIKVDVDTFERTFAVLESTNGIYRPKAEDDIRWRKEERPSGDDLRTIQIVFWESDDNFLEFSAFEDERNDRFEFTRAFYEDAKEQITRQRLTIANPIIEKLTWRDTQGEPVDVPPEPGAPAWKEEIWSIEYDADDDQTPYLKYRLLVKSKGTEKTKKAPGRRVGK